MKPLLDVIKAARRAELFAIIVLLAALVALWLNGGAGNVREVSGEKTELELRLQSILGEIEGTGEVEVMIAQDAGGTTVGAVIVAKRMEDVRTYLDLQSAVQALLGIDTSHIRIIGRQGTFGGGA